MPSARPNASLGSTAAQGTARGSRVIADFATWIGTRRSTIWLLTAGVLALAVVLFARLGPPPDHAREFQLTWWIFLAAGFAAAEIFVVHLHFRQNSHSFSLLEVPLVIGLFYASPLALLGAQMIGAGSALALHRRQSPVKLAFNLSSLALETTIAVTLFETASHALPDETAVNGLLAFPSTTAASILGVVLVFLAISISEGKFRLREIRTPLAFGAATTLFTTSIGVVAAVLLEAEPISVLFLGLPTCGVYLATTAYTRERQRHRGLEFLYESAKGLSRVRQIEPALLETLARARDAFNTEVAEVYLAPPNSAEMLRSTIGPGDVIASFQSVDSALHASVWQFFSAQTPSAIAVTISDGPDWATSYLQFRQIENAVLAPLRGDGPLLGFLLLGDRRVDVVGRFTRDDLKLAETLSNQLAIVLENGELERSLEQLARLKDELSWQALHDPLTGLANRTLFQSRVVGALGAGEAFGPVAVLFIDLDNFKTVNDSLGHAAGDRLLLAVGERLKSRVTKNDLVARLGGDEFAILLCDADTRARPLQIADAILEALSDPFDVDGTGLPVRASIGIATSSQSESVEQILRDADVAMYAAKAKGKNRTAMFHPDLLTAAMERYSLSADLERAVELDEFVVQFQPLVDLTNLEVVGVEALIRWEHPDRGRLYPDNFIQLAEEIHATRHIQRLVLTRVCEFLTTSDRVSAAAQPLYASINLTVRDIEQATVVNDVVEIAAIHGIRPERLLLEVSEAAFFHEAEAGKRNLQALRLHGARIALDDFGTGYSSLSQLRELPVDVIKVARQFVDDLHRHPQARAMSEAIVRLGHVLEKTVVAEGIERQDQLRLLAQMGCDLGQGYLLGRPMDADACLIWIRSRPLAGRFTNLRLVS